MSTPRATAGSGSGWQAQTGALHPGIYTTTDQVGAGVSVAGVERAQNDVPRGARPGRARQLGVPGHPEGDLRPDRDRARRAQRHRAAGTPARHVGRLERRGEQLAGPVHPDRPDRAQPHRGDHPERRVRLAVQSVRRPAERDDRVRRSGQHAGRLDRRHEPADRCGPGDRPGSERADGPAGHQGHAAFRAGRRDRPGEAGRRGQRVRRRYRAGPGLHGAVATDGRSDHARRDHCHRQGRCCSGRTPAPPPRPAAPWARCSTR